MILKAFKLSAGSQGCMNNFSFGNSSFGYYETIAGGSGAGPTFHGQSAVQTHMTNTRITDPEVLENRYPALLCKFQVRRGSGGLGKFNGGNGVIRKMLFLVDDIVVNILSERRVTQPFGLLGGEPGKRGVNVWIMKNEGKKNIGSRGCFTVKAGDEVKLLTPGGGGFGERESSQEVLGKRGGFIEVGPNAVNVDWKFLDGDDTEENKKSPLNLSSSNFELKRVKGKNNKRSVGSYEQRKINQISG